MNSKAKSIALFYFLLFALIGKTQQLSDIAALWNDGEFAVYGEEQSKMGTKAKIRFEKNDKQVIHKIFIDDKEFRANPNLLPYVRYYVGENDECLYINEKSIVCYLMNIYIEKAVRYKAVYGSKIKGDPLAEVKKYLDETYKLKEYTGVLHYNDIKSIECTVITKDNVALDYNTPFELGLTLKFNNGFEVKTKNLGGVSPEDSYFIQPFSGAESTQIGEKIYFKPDCKTMGAQGIVFKISPTSGILKNNGTSWTPKEITIPFSCNNVNSISMIRAKRWMQYDEIAFTIKDKDSNPKRIDLTKKSDLGYNDQVVQIDNMYRKFEPDFRLVRVKLNGKYGYADSLGKVVIPIEYEDGAVGYFEEKLILVKKAEKWGYVSDKNKIIVPFEFEKAFGFSNGMAVFMKNNKYGYINAQGKIVVEAIYDAAFDFNYRGSGIVILGGKSGLINTLGKVILPISQDKIFSVNSPNFWSVKNGDRYGLVDSKGATILPIEYDMIYPFEWGYARISKGGQYGYVKYDGTILAECKYARGENFNNGFAKIGKYEGDNIVWGVLDDNGNERWNDEPVSNNSSSGNATKTKTTATTKTSTKCTILNDLKPDQVSKYNDVRLVFDNSALVSKSLSRGQSMEVDCDDVIVHAGVLGSTDSKKVRKLFETKGKCGQTIKLSEYW
jgi:hypothetical protein